MSYHFIIVNIFEAYYIKNDKMINYVHRFIDTRVYIRIDKNIKQKAFIFEYLYLLVCLL